MRDDRCGEVSRLLPRDCGRKLTGNVAACIYPVYPQVDSLLTARGGDSEHESSRKVRGAITT